MHINDPAPNIAALVAVEVIHEKPGHGPAHEQRDGGERQADEQIGAARDGNRRHHIHRRRAERAIAVRIGATQHQHGNRHGGKGEQRAGIRHIGQQTHREESREQRDEDPRQHGDHMGRVELGVNLREEFRQQAIAAHHEEDAGLAEHHHQDHRGQRQDRRSAHQPAHKGMPHLTQRPGQRFLGANHGVIVDGRAGGGQRLSAGRKHFAMRAEHRLTADGADHARCHQHIKHGADREAADQANRHVALGVLGFLRRSGDRVKAHIGKEDRGRRARNAGKAQRGKGHEIASLDHRDRQGDKQGQGGDLDRHQDGVDRGALLGAQHKEAGDNRRDQHRGQIDQPPVKRPAHQRQRHGNVEGILHKADHIA